MRSQVGVHLSQLVGLSLSLTLCKPLLCYSFMRTVLAEDNLVAAGHSWCLLACPCKQIYFSPSPGPQRGLY